MTHSGAAEDDGRDSNEPGANAMRESGIPPAESRYSHERIVVDRIEGNLETALAESARTEANLNLLLRALEQIVSGASAARESNSMLSRELDGLREHLARSGADEMALRQRVRLLELAVDRARREAALEREFFLEQEDAFLAELLTDHEREVAELRRRLAEALTRTPTSGVVRLGTMKIPRPSPGGPTSNDSPPIDLLRNDPDATPIPRSSTPPGPMVAPVVSEASRPTPLPISTPAPATFPNVAAASPTPAKVPLLQKPDPATRPLVGYSLRDGEVAEERIERHSRRT